MPRPSQLILLVEDARHKHFLFKYLRKLGFDSHAMRFNMSPSGSGSGEQWVRDRFPIEVGAYRRRQTKAETKLIVLIDADTHTVQQRIRHLDEALRQAGIAPINIGDDQVARLIPKRNIETWLLCLSPELGAVNEEMDYKRTRSDWSALVRPAVDALYIWTRPQAEPTRPCVESLQMGIQELRELGL